MKYSLEIKEHGRAPKYWQAIVRGKKGKIIYKSKLYLNQSAAADDGAGVIEGLKEL